VASLPDGAGTVGAVVAAQTELVLVEDLLRSVPGREVVRRVRSLSPESVVAVQVADGGGVETALDAGARVAFTRRLPPSEVVDELLRCLHAPLRTQRTVVQPDRVTGPGWPALGRVARLS
jgi:DNA-binding NarL/FixJ family response regulator